MRARMGLWNAKLKYIHREVNLKNKPKAFLDVSPKGTVPVLVLPNGQVIAESLEILKWALLAHNESQWLTQDSEQGASMEALVYELDHTFKQYLNEYKYPERHGLESGESAKAKGEIYLKKLDEKLSSHPYLFGHKPSFADIAIFPFVRQFIRVDDTWLNSTPLLHLKQWYAHFSESTCFHEIMTKQDFWEDETSKQQIVELNS